MLNKNRSTYERELEKSLLSWMESYRLPSLNNSTNFLEVNGEEEYAEKPLVT